ncbi:Uncharacterised protein [Mycobacteroides abscessus subsp. abscessus]|nr:Uncharacterised protein [Mycobacteroides abscessus subsp. abscessus]
MFLAEGTQRLHVCVEQITAGLLAQIWPIGFLGNFDSALVGHFQE